MCLRHVGPVKSISYILNEMLVITVMLHTHYQLMIKGCYMEYLSTLWYGDHLCTVNSTVLDVVGLREKSGENAAGISHPRKFFAVQ